mgnify:CR=1 FL=1
MLDHYTTPGESIEIRDNQTIYSLLTDRLARTGADTVIAAKKIGPGRWQNVTTGEFHERVVSAAKGLIALGIAKGDAVTIFSSTRLEWGILDFALAAVGAVSVPIYDTDSAPQAQRIMNDSAVKLAFADNRERFDRLDSVKDHCPALKQILMIEGNALGALEGLGVAGRAYRVGACRRSGHHRLHFGLHRQPEGCRTDPQELRVHHHLRLAGVA